MELLVRANHDKVEEAKGMCEALRELFADEYEEAKKAGEDRVTNLLRRLESEKKQDDFNRAIRDNEYRQTLYRQYGL